MGDGSTIVEAGIMDEKKKLADRTDNKISHYYLKYTDTDNPYTFGTFGFGSLNCPAQLIKPQKYESGTDGFPDVTGKSFDGDGNQLANPACGKGQITYSGDSKDIFNTSLSDTKYENWVFKSNKFKPATIAVDFRAVTAVAPTGHLELFVTENNVER